MKVQYRYRGKIFDDIREITQNAKLKPDLDYILHEYIPFQVFITGRTFFDGVTVEATCKYSAKTHKIDKVKVEDLLQQDKYCGKNRIMPDAAAVSGGLDSSMVAFAYLPEMIYTGFYKDEGYDETPYAKEVANRITAQHITEELTEQDFLDNIYKMPAIFGIPIGGLGSIMEYVTLKKVLEKRTTKRVLFGLGGDEIFLGYFFNRFILNFYTHARHTLDYMINFRPSLDKIMESVADYMIISAMNRGGKGVLCSSFVKDSLEPILSSMLDPVDKLLFININYTLPALLHLNQQMCKALGVEGVNPFASEQFIKNAYTLNYPIETVPKQRLRNTDWLLPADIRNNYVKRGFPIPYQGWVGLNEVIRFEYYRFRNIFGCEKVIPKYPGINRFSWAVAQASIFEAGRLRQ